MSAFAKLVAKHATTAVTHVTPQGKRVRWNLAVSGLNIDGNPEQLAECVLRGDAIAQPALERDPLPGEQIPTDRKGNPKALWYSLGDGRTEFAAHLLGDDIYGDAPAAPTADDNKPARKPRGRKPADIPPAVAERIDAPAPDMATAEPSANGSH